MCRSIKELRNSQRQPTDEELRAAALQFVRKVSGFHHPSRSNQVAFDLAVDEIASAARRLFSHLVIKDTTPHQAPLPHVERPA